MLNFIIININNDLKIKSITFTSNSITTASGAFNTIYYRDYIPNGYNAINAILVSTSNSSHLYQYTTSNAHQCVRILNNYNASLTDTFTITIFCAKVTS